jgi:hypothetical protein
MTHRRKILYGIVIGVGGGVLAAAVAYVAYVIRWLLRGPFLGGGEIIWPGVAVFAVVTIVMSALPLGVGLLVLNRSRPRRE